MTTFYNFRDQCIKTYDEDLYECFSDAFESLPVAAVVNKTFLAVHGGISDKLSDLQKINEFERRMEPEAGHLLMDLLWADPMKQRHAKTRTFEENETRGVSVRFGHQPLKKLLDQEKLKSLVRGHELHQRGFKFHKWGSEDDDPCVITIFSAPNYCQSTNEAAVMSVSICLLYTSPSPRDRQKSRMPSSA